MKRLINRFMNSHWFRVWNKGWDSGWNSGYDFAIEDFVNRMTIIIPEYKQDILHIAEQLKENK